MPVVLQLSQSQAACLEFLSACKQAMIQAGQRWEFSFVMATYRCEQNWGTKLKLRCSFWIGFSVFCFRWFIMILFSKAANIWPWECFSCKMSKGPVEIYEENLAPSFCRYCKQRIGSPYSNNPLEQDWSRLLLKDGMRL